MIKIVLLPLDERPCNMIYPDQLFNHDDIRLIQPSKLIMGQKKIPADLKAIDKFLLAETKDAYGLVLSMDTLLYGGIVPSRLHQKKKETLESRFDIIRMIKKQNPALIIYAFDLIMRCPQYSSLDEEPDYYEVCGLEIFKSGYIGHKIELGLATENEKAYYDALDIKKEYLDDYLNRRELNITMNLRTLDFVEDDLIDFLIIPQDDAAEYGYTSKNQELLKKHIDQKQIASKVYMYPGADEVANTLISKMICKVKNIKPRFYIHYPSPASATTIPLLEDRYLDVTIRYQIRAAGGTTVSSISEADIVLFANASGTKMINSALFTAKRNDGLMQNRNLIDFVELMKEVIFDFKKLAVVADVATLNGSDHELMQLLQQKNLLLEISGYAGWNTSSNTLGTAIPFGIQTLIYGKTQQFYDFLMSRYVEDYGYMSYVRANVNGRLKEKNMNYFDVSANHEIVEKEVEKELKEFIHIYLPSIESHISIDEVWMPWKRMFEVGVHVSYKK